MSLHRMVVGILKGNRQVGRKLVINIELNLKVIESEPKSLDIKYNFNDLDIS
jgi:hypothetical protein